MHGAVAGILNEQHHPTWIATLLNTMQTLGEVYINRPWVRIVCLPIALIEILGQALDRQRMWTSSSWPGVPIVVMMSIWYGIDSHGSPQS